MVVTQISIISMRFLVLSFFFFLTSVSGSCNGVTHFTEVETSQYQMSPVWTFDNHVQNFTGISWFEAEIALKELGYCICLNERILNAAGNLINSGNEYFKVVKPPFILFGHNIYIIIFLDVDFVITGHSVVMMRGLPICRPL